MSRLPDYISKPRQKIDNVIQDTGTPELNRHHKVEPYVVSRSSTGQPTAVGARVMDQIPLDRYFSRGQLSKKPEDNDAFYTAGKRIAQDWYYSGIQPHMASNFQPRIAGSGGDKVDDIRVDALKRYKDAMKAVPHSLRCVIRDVCCFGESAKDWAVRNGQAKEAGITVLRLALEELAIYYGLIKKRLD